MPDQVNKNQQNQVNLLDIGISIATGIITTAASKTLTAPLEFLQLRFQLMNQMIRNKTLENKYKSIMNCIKSTVKEEGGYKALWKGNFAFILMGSANSILSVVLSQKVKYQIDNAVKNMGQAQNSLFKYASLFISILSSGWILFFTYPFDYARIRLITDKQCALRQGGKQFSGIFDVLKTTLKNDGIRGLYRGILLSYTGIIVYRGSYFGFYDLIKSYSSDSNLIVKFMLAYMTTIVAGTVMYPIDTIRKRMMMRSLQSTKYSWSGSCMSYIAENEGLRGYYGGYGIKLVRGVFSSFILMFYDKITEIYSPKNHIN